ncbi:odorant receptor 9a-like isoform X1 [Venturia canescens]|uniref:odorant receptor 9a-like isoform X1 n=2 Tax=Venturia canescens TaxID=32260 RepID=UPI001C9CBE30|nr:odorant receptor 9a-like isoform X1 [Venturia canescens]XP_043273898.1 odorant receptor 9a-like isoform X1 [Venturia canescens]
MTSFFDHPYYKWNKVSLMSIGTWPEQSLFVTCFMSTFVCANLLSMFIPEGLYLKNKWPDTDAFLDWLAPFCILTMAVIQLLNGSFQRKKFSTILKHISSDWKRFGDSPNAEILHKYAARGRWITKAYISWMYSACTCYLMMPFLTPKIVEFFVPSNESEGKIYLFNSYYGVNSDDYYFFIFGHMFWGSWVPIIVMISSDAMFFVFVEHACALFKIVETNLKSTCNHYDATERCGNSSSFQIICHCIDLHQNAIIFTSLIDSAYNLSLLGVLGASLLALSVTGLQVLMHLHDPGQLIRFGSFSLAQIFHLYLNSVPGQKIMDHSTSIFDYAYSVNWYALTPRARKLLILIMVRSLRPCQISAGKIYLLTMENYSAMMQTSMSFFTVLSSMR